MWINEVWYWLIARIFVRISNTTFNRLLRDRNSYVLSKNIKKFIRREITEDNFELPVKRGNYLITLITGEILKLTYNPKTKIWSAGNTLRGHKLVIFIEDDDRSDNLFSWQEYKE